MTKKYDKEFLISELRRFYDENGRVPTSRDMSSKNGYPSFSAYVNHFKTFNNALEIAKLKLNKKHHIGTLDGTEVCSYCGCSIDQTPSWRYDEDGNRFCKKHGNSGGKGKPDYVMGNLDINSEKGLGRVGEILVIKTLGIGKEHDCNRENCNYPIDMYHKDYGRIDAKISKLSYTYNYWQFTFNAKKDADTYICIGLSSNRKRVEHVWIVPNKDEIKDLQNFGVYDSYRSLLGKKHWEVNAKPYNDVWQTMKLKTCNSMVDKSKDGYVEPIKHVNIISSVVKKVEQVIDKTQYRLNDF